MSVEAMAAVWASLIGDPTRKLVLLAVANEARCADGTGAYAAMSTYAEHAECAERTVQRHITALIASGWLREGDQSIAEYIPKRRRPIVYDVAMSGEIAREWRESISPGRRDRFIEPGVKGGKASAAKRWGDTESPNGGDGESPVVSPHENGTTQAPWGDRWGDTWGDTRVTQTKEPSSYGRNQRTNQNHGADAPPPPQPPKAANDKTPEARIANRFHDHTEGMCNWAAVMGMAKSALRVHGATEQSIGDIMCSLYDAGKPLTKTLIGQVASGIVDMNGVPTNGSHTKKRATSDERIAQGDEVKAKLAARMAASAANTPELTEGKPA